MEPVVNLLTRPEDGTKYYHWRGQWFGEEESVPGPLQ